MQNLIISFNHLLLSQCLLHHTICLSEENKHYATELCVCSTKILFVFHEVFFFFNVSLFLFIYLYESS